MKKKERKKIPLFSRPTEFKAVLFPDISPNTEVHTFLRRKWPWVKDMEEGRSLFDFYTSINGGSLGS